MPEITYTTFRPYGQAREAWHTREPEVLLSGPAGTGKTRALLELIHFRALKHPGFRGLIARKERKTLTQTALVTFNKEVRPELDGVVWHSLHQEYQYPNGSVLAVAGLDKEGRKVFSGQYDQVYVNEATELAEPEWENLCTRLRNARAPRQQLIADCNPDRPTHWLKRRSDAGKTRLLESRHEDNPTLWDGQAWTPKGLAYLAVLDALTGARLLRLRHGRWVQSAGVVYEGWDPALHLLDPSPVPHDWPRLLSVDFGFVNPFVCQWWALDPDNRLHLYREIYRAQRLVEDHARDIARLSAGEPAPVAVVCDHDAEDRATLECHLGWETTPAVKARQLGFQAVAARLKRAGDGRPRLFVHRGALVERDAALDDAKKPCCTAEEFDGYVWSEKKADEPVKVNDHGMDALRYVVATLDGEPAAGNQQQARRRVLV